MNPPASTFQAAFLQAVPDPPELPSSAFSTSSNPFFLHQTFPYCASKANFLHDKKIQTLHYLTPACSSTTFSCPKHQALQNSCFSPSLPPCSNLCIFAHTILLPCCLSSFNLTFMRPSETPFVGQPPGRIILLPSTALGCLPRLFENSVRLTEYLISFLLPCLLGAPDDRSVF